MTTRLIRRAFSLGILATALVAACAEEAGRGTAPSAPTTAETPRAQPLGEPLAAGVALPDDRVASILELMLDVEADPAPLRTALEEIVSHRDLRFIAVLIELVDSGASRRAKFDPAVVDALHALSGQRFGRSWEQWAAWYGTTDLDPPPGFMAWKARTLSPIDARFGEFLYSEAPHTIRIEEIVWGGVPVDGILPLDTPPVLAATDALYLDPAEPVFGIVVNGEARAYPLRIMDAHELANDVLGGQPISLVYCTLCGSGIAYDTRAEGGTVFTFSTSGLLHQSNKLMYDRQTKSLWQQFTGRPVVGPLVRNGTHGAPRLRPLPLVLASWQDWKTAHPDTTVLSLETGRGRGYTLGYPYLQYFASGDTMFPLAQRSTLLASKEWIYGLTLGDVDRAYPLRDLTERGVTNDHIAGLDIVLVAPHPVIDVEAEAGRVGILSYEAGGTVRVFARPRGLQFAAGPSVDVLLDETGATWQVTEDGLVGPGGEVGERIVGTLSFWFGWFSFHPRTELFSRT